MDLKKLMARVLVLCENDEEFRRQSHFVVGNVRLGIGSYGFMLQFFGGHRLISISEENDPLVAYDYEIVGTEDEWARIWKGEMDLTQAVLPQQSAITVRGNRVKYAGEVRILVHLTRLMPLAAKELCFDVLPLKPTPPEGSPNPWAMHHEVAGRYIDVEGIRTYYETIGEKGSVTFLAMHTAGRDCRQWQQFGDIVGGDGQLVALDLPGHGKSWPLPGGRCLESIGDIASFTWAFRKAIGISTTTVVIGCSMGGNLVFQLAADYPQEVAALVSLQGADCTLGDPEAARVLMDHPMVNPAYYHIDRTVSLTGDRTPIPQRDYLQWEATCYSSVSIKADITAFSIFDFRNRMSEIRCPALLIRGKNDWAVTERMVNETASRLVNAKAVEVIMPEGVGHFAHFEQPKEIGMMVLNFLQKHGVV